MLKDGQIDLLADVSVDPDREKEMNFSSLPMGTEKYYIYTDLSRSGISVSNLKTLNGKKIGVIADSIPLDMVTKWTKEHDINAEIIPVQSF